MVQCSEDYCSGLEKSGETFEEDDGSEGHDDHADEEVSHCQGHQEVVRHVLQLPGDNTLIRWDISDICDARDMCIFHSAMSDIIEINLVA